MDNIVRLSPALILELMGVLSYADSEGRSVRITTGTDSTGPFIMYDAGGGWTPPLYGLDY